MRSLVADFLLSAMSGILSCRIIPVPNTVPRTTPSTKVNNAFPEPVSSDSSAVASDGADNNSNSFAAVLRVDDVTSKSIKVRLETRSGSSPLVPQKIFFKNVQRNSDWKHYVVDEKRTS